MNGNTSDNPNADSERLAVWAARLPIARITNWGSMISTPAEHIQQMIGNTLELLGCPPYLAKQMADCSHESNWPSSLQTLRVRQTLRRHYNKYICKRIPETQSILILYSDNRHMPPEMIQQPGFIMTFANGVE